MKKIYYFSLFFFISFYNLTAQDKTASYINSVHYSNKLNLLRTSYDRWQIVFNKYWEDDPDPYKKVPVSSAINDFNWAQDVNGKSIYPMSIGYALGKKYVRYYFLLSSSDLPNLWKDSTGKSGGNFQAATVGMNFNVKYATIQGDVTYSENGLEYYGKLFSPQAKSHIGIGFSNYEELKDSISTKIVESKKALFNALDFNTSIVKYFNIGLRYYNISQVKYVPNINTALHQYLGFDKWAKMPGDLELFFETRGEKLSNLFSMKDWETRLVYYQFIGRPLVSEKLEGNKGGICVRPALFLGVSYKSEEDGYAQTLTESGMVYNGQNGFGIEGGFCLRALGFTEFGFKDASYVKFSVFYNYSQYYERFPGIKAGLKFRVLM